MKNKRNERNKKDEKDKKNKRWFWLFCLFSLFSLLLSMFIPASFALDIIPSNSNYYYKLGGGSDISMPPVTDQQSVTIGDDMNANLGFSCGGFNPAISIANTLNNLENSIEALSRDIINSATAFIITSPLYFLEQKSPEIYNYLQNGMHSAQDTFHLSVKSCQDALNSINQGKSPYQDWASISDSQGWLNYSKSAEQGQNTDVNAAKKQVAKDPKKYGIPWVHKGQNSGGSIGSQVPIKIIYDVVVAGYNVMIDPQRPLDSNDAAPNTSELTRFWKTPDAAGRWSQLVLGDITISANAPNSTHAGIGLVPILRICPDQKDITCAKTIRQKLADIVNNGSYPTADELNTISSSQMMITPDVIASIRNMDTQNRAVTISKISEDVAIRNLVDEALLLRRILIAGSQTKPVHNSKPALTTVRQTIQDLDQDIDNVLYEQNIRKQLGTDTLQSVLSEESINKAQALSQHETTQEPLKEQGAVYKGE